MQLQYTCLYQHQWWPLIFLFLCDEIVSFAIKFFVNGLCTCNPHVFTSKMIPFSVCCTFLMAEVLFCPIFWDSKYQMRSEVFVISPRALKRKRKYLRSLLTYSLEIHVYIVLFFSTWSLIIFIRDCEHLNDRKILKWLHNIKYIYIYAPIGRLPMHTMSED